MAMVHHKSPTQLQTFEDCERKWGWRKLDGLERSAGPAAEFGDRTHAQLEGYLKGKHPLDLTTDEGKCAMSGIHLLSQKGVRPGAPGMLVETHGNLMAWGHWITMRKDVVLRRPGQRSIIFDHKTTSGLKWAKTPEELIQDIQFTLYAVDEMKATGIPEVEGRWVYYKSSKPFKAEPRDVPLFTKETAEPVLVRIKDLADRMDRYRAEGRRALQLIPNPSACEKYGGCPYRSDCNLSPLEKALAHMDQADEQQKREWLAKARQKQAEQGGAAPGQTNPTQTPPPLPGAAPTGPIGLPPGAIVNDSKTLYWAPGMTDWAPLPQAPTPPPLPQGPPPEPKPQTPPPEPAAAQTPPPEPAQTPPPLPQQGPPPEPGTTPPPEPSTGKGGKGGKGSKTKAAGAPTLQADADLDQCVANFEHDCSADKLAQIGHMFLAASFRKRQAAE